MSRGALALAILLAIAPLLAVPGAAQLPGAPGFVVPTQKDVQVGDLNVTTWIMHGAASSGLGPIDPANPFGSIFNLNFSAGEQGILYFKANRTPHDAVYQVRASVVATPATFGALDQNASLSLVPRPCKPAGLSITCDLNATTPTADWTMSLYPWLSTTPGPVELVVSVESWKDEGGALQFQTRGNVTYTLNVLPPAPSFAAVKRTADVDVYAWVQGSNLGFAGTGCQTGAQVRNDHNITRGFPSVLCMVAVGHAADAMRITATAETPASLTQPLNATWQSGEFNVTSGGILSPMGSLFVQATPTAPIGAGEITVRYTIEKRTQGVWTEVGSDSLTAPFAIARANALRGPFAPVVHWEFQIPVFAMAVAGLGYMVYKHRPPKVQPRSQALRDLRKSKGGDGGSAASAAVVQQQRADVEQASWDKKRQILEAKREDILQSIRIAEERKQRGEITDHILTGIKDRKQRQLEQVEHELGELRG